MIEQTLTGQGRVFLFLQFPHGPFAGKLADALGRTGAQVYRVGFNAGDRAFWGRRGGYVAFRGPVEDWPTKLDGILAEHAVTDIVLYGDTRPVHAIAITKARALGLGVHVLEEGYLRPYWSTYERGGSNGNSVLAQMSVDQMRDWLGHAPKEHVEAPGHWGELRAHVFWGAAYHFCVLVGNWPYRRLRPHRAVSVGHEFRLYARKLLLMPWTWATNKRALARIGNGDFPYHLGLLQLEHDANFRAHSDFESQTDFVRQVIAGFANGAPKHHHLVFKAHPLEDGRAPLSRSVHKYAAEFGVSGRVHYLTGGKLIALIRGAKTAVTVNSTAAQQVLWHGVPLKAVGRSVYDKPDFVSDQPLAEFFANPTPPDVAAYLIYRSFLLETSQFPGSFYSSKGRRQLVRKLVDAVLSPTDPYSKSGQNRRPTGAADRQHLPRGKNALDRS